jgi:hypothetical protein
MFSPPACRGSSSGPIRALDSMNSTKPQASTSSLRQRSGHRRAAVPRPPFRSRSWREMEHAPWVGAVGSKGEAVLGRRAARPGRQLASSASATVVGRWAPPARRSPVALRAPRALRRVPRQAGVQDVAAGRRPGPFRRLDHPDGLGLGRRLGPGGRDVFREPRTTPRPRAAAAAFWERHSRCRPRSREPCRWARRSGWASVVGGPGREGGHDRRRGLGADPEDQSARQSRPPGRRRRRSARRDGGEDPKRPCGQKRARRQNVRSRPCELCADA